MSGDICIDNRFELIGKYQKILIDRTNITDSPDEMKALYSILYRCWQMGWLDRLDTIADMQAENAKLRELVRGMAHVLRADDEWRDPFYCNPYCADQFRCRSEDCVEVECPIVKSMRELGVEV